MERFFRSKVADAGRIVIPVDLRRSLGLSEGDELVFSRDGPSIRITPLRLAIEEAQDFFSSLPPAEAATAVDEQGPVRCEDTHE